MSDSKPDPIAAVHVLLYCEVRTCQLAWYLPVVSDGCDSPYTSAAADA